MFNAATYSATDRLRDGRTLEVRALKPSDETEMMAAVGRIGAQSLYRRFMGAKRGFSDKERAFFLNVDFINHVALVAVVRSCFDRGRRPLYRRKARDCRNRFRRHRRLPGTGHWGGFVAPPCNDSPPGRPEGVHGRGSR